MRYARLAAAVCFVSLGSAAPARAQLRSYAGVVAGNAHGTSTFSCATSAYSIGSPWFAGLALPTDGSAACGLNGVVDDKSAAVGPLVTTAKATGPMAGNVGNYTGTAGARADYWNLGVRAEGVSTGLASTSTYRQSAAFASFAQDLVYTDPSVANGTAGITNFTFSIDGLLKSVPVAPYGQQGDIYFSMLVNNLLWNSFVITALDNGLPSIRGASSGLPGDFVVTPGTASGSATFTTISNFAMVWGTALHVEVAMYSTVSPCCLGASLTSDFYNSVKLTGIDAYAGSNAVSDFLVNTSSGQQLNAQGVIPVGPPSTTVPEPTSMVLTLAGLAGVGLEARRRSRRRLC